MNLDGEPVDEAKLRAGIVAHLGALPADPNATRPYRDAREVVAEPDDVSSWRGRQRDRWLADVTRSTRANLPRFRPPPVAQEPRPEPISEVERRRAARRRTRYDELEVIRRALHAYVDGTPSQDPERRAAHRAAVPFRARVGDVVTWIGGLVGLWEERWQAEGDDWPEAARRLGAPPRPIAFPGPRVTGREVRRAHERVRRLRGFDYVFRGDYLLEEMRTLVQTYDLIDELEQTMKGEANTERADIMRDLIEELRDVMLGDSIATIADAAGTRLNRAAA